MPPLIRTSVTSVSGTVFASSCERSGLRWANTRAASTIAAATTTMRSPVRSLAAMIRTMMRTKFQPISRNGIATR